MGVHSVKSYHHTDRRSSANPIGATATVVAMTNRGIALALSGNLQRLMAHQQLSQAALSRKAGVGQSTLSNILDTEHPLEINPRTDTIEKLAKYFGIPGWQLLIPDLALDLLLSDRLGNLVDRYRAAPEQDRETLDRLAETAARYARNTPLYSKTG